MRTIETTATITAEGTLTVHVPPDIPPGPHYVVVVIDDRPAPNLAKTSFTPVRT